MLVTILDDFMVLKTALIIKKNNTINKFGTAHFFLIGKIRSNW